MNTTNQSQSKTKSSDTQPVEVSKYIAAPAESVFAALSHEELIREWWGPEGFECPMVKMDFKVGGKYIFEMRNSDGKIDIFSSGQFTLIEKNRRVVMTDYPADSQGNRVTSKDVEGPFADNGDAKITFGIEYRGENECILHLTHEGLPARMHEKCVEGWASSLRKFARVVEKH